MASEMPPTWAISSFSSPPARNPCQAPGRRRLKPRCALRQAGRAGDLTLALGLSLLVDIQFGEAAALRLHARAALSGAAAVLPLGEDHRCRLMSAG